jgi:hypothetical protein
MKNQMVCGPMTKVTRAWKAEDDYGRSIEPVQVFHVEQGSNTVVLSVEQVMQIRDKWMQDQENDKGVGGQLSDLYIDLGRRLSKLYVGGNNFQGGC